MKNSFAPLPAITALAMSPPASSPSLPMRRRSAFNARSSVAIAQRQTSDLLFFYHRTSRSFLITSFLSATVAREEGENDWVVYQTGAAPENARREESATGSLDHTHGRWRPPRIRTFWFYRLRSSTSDSNLWTSKLLWRNESASHPFTGSRLRNPGLCRGDCRRVSARS